MKWEVYKKKKEKLIKRHFSVVVLHLRGERMFELVFRIILLRRKRIT